jgi:hypothetical protein
VKGRNPFSYLIKDNVIEVWLGEPKNPESEYICAVDKVWIPQLIATLRQGELELKGK